MNAVVGPTQPGDSPPPAPAHPPAVRFRFPRSLRVLSRRDFQRVQGRGVRLGGDLVLVLAMRQQGAPRPARLGLTVSRKCGGSVQRNRIRRVLREAFRLQPGLFPPGHDIVVIAREGTLAITLDGARGEFVRAAARLARGPRPQNATSNVPSQKASPQKPLQRPPAADKP